MKKNVFLYLILSILAISSCEKNDEPGGQKPDLIKITNAVSEDGTFEIELYSMADTLFEGYNKVFFSVKDAESGNMISEAELALNPLMHMVDKKHAAPAENPNPVSSEEGYFEGAVVFIMPSNPDEGWFLDVDMSIAGAETSASLEIPWVKSLDEPRMIKVLSDVDGTVYFVSCLEPAEPEVGINPCEFTIHYKQSMMSFPAAEDLAMEIEPEMPSMEHGSPNNENPVHTANGHYVGKLNFTMTGWWRVHITLKKGDDVICDDRYMDITF